MSLFLALVPFSRPSKATPPDPDDNYDGYYGKVGAERKTEIKQDAANYSAVEGGPIDVNQRFNDGKRM